VSLIHLFLFETGVFFGHQGPNTLILVASEPAHLDLSIATAIFFSVTFTFTRASVFLAATIFSRHDVGGVRSWNGSRPTIIVEA
jgi:hypothetical protein